MSNLNIKEIGLQKELDYILLAKNNVWTIFIATSGGTLGSMFLLNSILKWIVIMVGIILSVVFLENYFRKDAKIESIIKKLKEGN